MKLIIFITLFLLNFCQSALAAPGSWSPQFKEIRTIIIEEGTALILIEGGVHPDYIPEACNSPYNKADLSTEHSKALYSMALAAKLSGIKVKVALHCAGSRPRITHMQLQA